MLATTVFELLYETLASRVALYAVSPLLRNEIDKYDYVGQLNTLGGLLRTGIGSYGATKLGVMEIDTQRPMLHGVLAKNGILHVSLNVINAVKDGCFGAVSMATSKGLVYFGRKNGDQLKRSHIGHEFYLLSTAGYE